MSETSNKRTVRFHGIGFGPTPAEIRVIYRPPHGVNEVEYVVVPTINAPVPDALTPLDPKLCQVVFTIKLPINFTGCLPMSVHCTQGTAVILKGVDANYGYEDTLNPKYTAKDRLILDNPNSLAKDRAEIWRRKATPPFDDKENAIIDAYISNPTKETYQTAKWFFYLHGLESVSSGPDVFRKSCFEGDARQNCCLDEIPIRDNREAIEKTMTWPGKLGTFERKIPQNSTLTFDLAILAGME
jgi:hypothetical protein